MRSILKKEVLAGVIISSIIFSMCFYLAADGGGPCTAGIGIFMDLFILVGVMVISGICMMLRNPRISLVAQTVLVLTFIALIILFLLIRYF